MLIIAASIFVCVTLGVLGVYWLMFRPPSAATERLRSMGESGGLAPAASAGTLAPDESLAGALAERMAAPLSKLAPPSAAQARQLQKKLMQAGCRSANAPVIFRGVQLAAITGLPALVALVCAVIGRPLGSAVFWIAAGVAAGFLVPRFALDRMVKGRQLRVRWGLADALDLMVVSIESGLGLNASMVRVGEELKVVHPEISEEFEIANLEIRVGREREEALRNLAERTGVDDLRSLVAMLIQADRFGTSIAQALRIHADTLRQNRQHAAEEMAAKASVKMTFPLVLFVFPATFIILAGPTVVKMMQSPLFN
jgi:tight adherence protein C